MAGVKRKKNGHGYKNKKNAADRGFSLVEVLVCIAILAIVSVSILSGIRTSSKLNYNAHYTQKLTAYAQKELERINAMSVEDYETLIKTEPGGEGRSPITAGALYDKAQEILNNFSGKDKLSDEEKIQLFYPFMIKKENIKIGNKTYTMRAIFEPAEYSRENADSGELASNINIASIGSIAEADAALFPVISTEINRYEASAGSGGPDPGSTPIPCAIVQDIQNRLEALGEAAEPEAIATGMKKEIIIDIETLNTIPAQVQVTCDIGYSFEGVELNYRVYSGEYPYAPVSSEIDAGTAGDYGLGEAGGGKVFLFARAFQDMSAITAGAHEGDAHCLNSLKINVAEGADMPVNVYLVKGGLGEGSDRIEFNFDEILINGDNYFTKLNGPDGEMPLEKGSFYTNIKSKKWNYHNLTDEEQEKERFLGETEPETRCYTVTVEMLEEDGDSAEEKVMARVTAAKTER